MCGVLYFECMCVLKRLSIKLCVFHGAPEDERKDIPFVIRERMNEEIFNDIVTLGELMGTILSSPYLLKPQ